MNMTDRFEQEWKERFSKAATSEGQNKDQSLLIEGNPHYRKYFLEYAGAVLLRPRENMTVLDVGCGTGSTCRVLAERGFEVYGVDFSPEIIEVAKKKAAQGGVSLRLQVADIYQLPFEDSMFDIVICNYLFQTVSEPEKVLQEVLRVLKPGGRVFIITLNGLSFGRVLLRDDLKLYDPRQMKKTMEHLGFRGTSVQGVYLFTKVFDWLVGWILRFKLYRVLNAIFPISVFFSHSFYLEARKP